MEINNCKLVKTSYSKDDVTILLKDLTGQITALDTEEREKLIQSGKHYSEMLPVEYEPTKQYLSIYNEILEMNKEKLAKAIVNLAKNIYELYCNKSYYGYEGICLVSLARAGTPIGILLKRTLEKYYSEIKNVEHYSISIIRDKGIDINALKFITHNTSRAIIFVDGWIGKGVIQNELIKSINKFEKYYPELSHGIINKLFTVSDPGYINKEQYCGTREDFMIPNACLNATVNGLFSRTVRNEEFMQYSDFDGAVHYPELKENDLSLKFIETIMNEIDKVQKIIPSNGLSIIEQIAKDYDIKDINKIKPGIGETIRVLLRRVPDRVIINVKEKYSEELKPVIQLCREKDVDIEYTFDKNDNYLGNYKCVGIIKEMEKKDL